MKQITNYIIEKFKINSKTVFKKKDIDIDIERKEKVIFDDKELDIIKQYALELKETPVVLTNKKFGNNLLINLLNHVFLYFNDNWKESDQDNYLVFIKDIYNGYWTASINIGKDYYSLCDDNDKTMKGDINDICLELFNQLKETPKFYNAIKK